MHTRHACASEGQVRELKISNDAKEELSNGIDESENEIAQNEANFIANQFYKEFDSEDVGRVNSH